MPSFEGEVRGYFAHRAETDPVLQALEEGTLNMSEIDVQTALEMAMRSIATHTKLIIRIAKEIDELRAAASGG